METLFAIGIGQGITLGLMLLLKSYAARNETWLMGFFILFVTAYISGPILNSIFGEPFGSIMIDPWIFLIGPSFYGYIKSLSSNLKYGRFLIHCTPFFLYLPLLFYIYQSANLDNNYPHSLQSFYSSTQAIILGIIKFIHLFFYVGLSFFELHKHQKKIKMAFSNLKGKDLAWLKYMLIGFLVLSVLSFFLYVLALRFPENQTLFTSVNLLLLMAFLFFVAIYAFRQETIFDSKYNWLREMPEKSIIGDSSPTLPKYEKSGLKSEEVKEINRLLDEFILHKGFLNPELSLASLAEQLGVPPHKISEVLSKYRQTSFYGLINSHRVEAVKSALNDPKYRHLSILGIAFEFGYNSKSTFNTAFKKFTGSSPSKYRQLVS